MSTSHRVCRSSSFPFVLLCMLGCAIQGPLPARTIEVRPYLSNVSDSPSLARGEQEILLAPIGIRKDYRGTAIDFLLEGPRDVTRTVAALIRSDMDLRPDTWFHLASADGRTVEVVTIGQRVEQARHASSTFMHTPTFPDLRPYTCALDETMERALVTVIHQPDRADALVSGDYEIRLQCNHEPLSLGGRDWVIVCNGQAATFPYDALRETVVLRTASR